LEHEHRIACRQTARTSRDRSSLHLVTHNDAATVLRMSSIRAAMSRVVWLRHAEFHRHSKCPATSRIERCTHCSRGAVIDCSCFVTWATIGHGFGTDLCDDSLSRDASDQRVAVSVNLGEELLAQDVNRRDTRQVEQNSLVRLSERRGRPISRQFADPQACESTVKSKGSRPSSQPTTRRRGVGGE